MFSLKTIATAAALSALAVAGAASARPELSDAQYLAAARCQTLMSSASLGAVDTGAIDSVLKTQARGRTPMVEDRADAVRAETRRAVSHAGQYGKAALVAERDGVCASMTHDTVVAMGGAGSAGR